MLLDTNDIQKVLNVYQDEAEEIEVTGQMPLWISTETGMELEALVEMLEAMFHAVVDMGVEHAARQFDTTPDAIKDSVSPELEFFVQQTVLNVGLHAFMVGGRLRSLKEAEQNGSSL